MHTHTHRSIYMYAYTDELDAIGTKRQDSELSGDREVQRTMLELLNQLDGFSSNDDVKVCACNIYMYAPSVDFMRRTHYTWYVLQVIAATNRPDILDPALLRSGRLDRKIELPHPNEGKNCVHPHSSCITTVCASRECGHEYDVIRHVYAEARARILEIHSRRMVVDRENVDFKELARATDEFNGAQLKAVCVEAGMSALRRNAKKLVHEDFVDGITVVQAKKKSSLNYFA